MRHLSALRPQINAMADCNAASVYMRRYELANPSSVMRLKYPPGAARYNLLSRFVWLSNVKIRIAQLAQSFINQAPQNFVCLG